MKYLDNWAIPNLEIKMVGVLSNLRIRHINDNLTLINYQEPIRKLAVSLCSELDIFIDVGANIGIWSAPLSKLFQKTLAFEVNSYLTDCYNHNILTFGRPELVQFFPFGLANRSKKVSLLNVSSESCWGTYIGEAKDSEFEVKSLDELTSSLVPDGHKISLIKLDIEGGEPYALCGMMETILKYKPIVVIEEKSFVDRYPYPPNTGLNIIKTFGAKELHRIKKDYIFGW